MAVLNDDIAHRIVEIAHQVIGSESELGFGYRFDGFRLEEQVKQRDEQGEGKQGEENRHQVKEKVQ